MKTIYFLAIVGIIHTAISLFDFSFGYMAEERQLIKECEKKLNRGQNCEIVKTAKFKINN